MTIGIKMHSKPFTVGNKSNSTSTMGHKLFDKPEAISPFLRHPVNPIIHNESNSLQSHNQPMYGNQYKAKNKKPFIMEKQRKHSAHSDSD